jgi:hypothetical protein
MLSEKIWIFGIWIAELLGKQGIESSTDGLGYAIDKYDESPEV